MLKNSPYLIKIILVTLYGMYSTLFRRLPPYRKWKKYYSDLEYLTYEELLIEQRKRLLWFLKYVKNKSKFYSQIVISNSKSIEGILSSLDHVSKNDLIQKSSLLNSTKLFYHKSKTGGTTGASLVVKYFWSDFRERMAFLDFFRERYGWRFRKKTAWFSGKSFVNENNRKKNLFWINDYFQNIIYFSTFNINSKTYKYYLRELANSKVEYIVGFPSSVFLLANFGYQNKIDFFYNIKCFFPTAESITNEQKAIIQKYFNCEIRNQYASSEGAPFVTECEKGNLHYEMLTGVINNISKNNNGILVTSFTTRGFPLINYSIGDNMVFSTLECNCGRKTPLIKSIVGRTIDFILLPSGTKVNLGNISNSTKGVKGIINFQLIQNVQNEVVLRIVVTNVYTKKDENVFLNQLQERFDNELKITIEYVNDIPLAQSGKYQLIVNNLNGKQ